MRIALYARYSTDMQDARSIDDQVRLCRAHAEKLGFDIAEVYADYAISGGSLRNRPEALRLMTDAAAGRFDIVIAEALDRLSRDQEDIAGIFLRLSFARVQLWTVAEGEIGEVDIGLKGTMNALFLKDLAAKTKRGQAGRAAAGLAPGGLSYGYDMVRTLDAKGEIDRGLRFDQSSAVRNRFQDFEEYAAGRSPRAIVADLNAEGVPSPSGKLGSLERLDRERQQRAAERHPPQRTVYRCAGL